MFIYVKQQQYINKVNSGSKKVPKKTEEKDKTVVKLPKKIRKVSTMTETNA